MPFANVIGLFVAIVATWWRSGGVVDYYLPLPLLTS